jgi:hypothetical protein
MEIDGPWGSDETIWDIAARVFSITGEFPGPEAI